MSKYKDTKMITIKPPDSGYSVDWQALWEYRDLFVQLTWRNIKTRYPQSALGIGWVVLQPVATTVVFTTVFGHWAGIPSEGVPYPLFSFAALVPWTYFSGALAGAVGSLVSHADMLRKIWFPRLLLPFSMIAARLLDLFVTAVLLIFMMVWYAQPPTLAVFALPFLVLIMLLTVTGLSLWLAALAVQYRDVNHALPLVLQLLLYATPVIYPANIVPPEFQRIYALNPMVGVIEGLRASLFGLRTMPWELIGIGGLVAVFLFLVGLRFFLSREHVFADVA
jgi:lipopolysaccharide transport system permease protein